MKPFLTSATSRVLDKDYPDLESIIGLLKCKNQNEVNGFCRQWISEGVPYLFADNPMLYEIIRGWVAQRIGIHAKEVTLIGSARMGYSLAPGNKLGREFSHRSDLDFAAISEDFYIRSFEEVNRFTKDLKKGSIKPNTVKLEKLWPEIAADLNRTGTTRGFVDIWKLPNFDRYPLAKSTANTFWLLREKLKITDKKYATSKASIRVYRDFPSFAKQINININAMADFAMRNKTKFHK